MQVHVRFAEPFWRVVGQRELDVELVNTARVADLLTFLCQRYPELARELNEAPPSIFLGDQEVDLDSQLVEGSQVHFVWPLAGG